MSRNENVLTTGAEPSGVAVFAPETVERIRSVCRSVNAPPTDAPAMSVRAILKVLSEEGMLDLGYLQGTQAAITADDLRRIMATVELLSGESAAVGSAFMINAVFAASIIAMMGTPEQRSELLPKLRSADLQFAFAMTEPNAGSDAAGMTCSATPTSAGFVLNGEKIYTTGASSADYLLVVARVDGAKSRDFSVFLVPTTSAGLSIEPLKSLPGHIHPSCRVKLDNVPIPQSAVLGGSEGQGQAWNVLKQTGALERLVVAFCAVGLGAAVVRRATEFAQQRQQFGQAIASFQAIQHSLVDMAIIERTMRLLAQDALNCAAAGKDATQQIVMAKCYCSEQLQELIGRGMRVMGGRAFFDFEDMARYYLEAPLSLYAGGTVEIHKMLIARTLGI